MQAATRLLLATYAALSDGAAGVGHVGHTSIAEVGLLHLARVQLALLLLRVRQLLRGGGRAYCTDKMEPPYCTDVVL